MNMFFAPWFLNAVKISLFQNFFLFVKSHPIIIPANQHLPGKVTVCIVIEIVARHILVLHHSFQTM